MRLLDFIFAARPLLLVPVWTIYLVALHYHHELSGQSFDMTDLGVLAGLTALFAAAYYINQVFDRDSDRVNNKVGFLQRDFLNERKLMAGYISLIVVGLAIAPMIGLQTFAIFVQIVLLGYIYSAPPLRLKDRPVWGLFANAYAIGTLVSFSVMPELTQHNAGLLGWDNPFYFTLAVASVYLITTVPDVDGDRATGKKTIAVWLGIVPAQLLALLFMIGAAYVAYMSAHPALFYLAVVGALAILAAIVIPARSASLFAAKLPILLLTLLAGYWYPGYFVFIVALLVGTRLYYQKRFGIVYPRLA